jgi:hypothetical protein
MAARLDHPLIVECNGSHEAMLTQPKAVANALRAAIEPRRDAASNWLRSRLP